MYMYGTCRSFEVEEKEIQRERERERYRERERERDISNLPIFRLMNTLRVSFSKVALRLHGIDS